MTAIRLLAWLASSTNRVDGPATTGARGVPDGSAQERSPTHGNDKDSPPITEMPTKGNARWQVAQPSQEMDLSLTKSSISANQSISRKDEREAMLRLLRRELPERLSGRTTASVLRVRVEALVQANWTAKRSHSRRCRTQLGRCRTRRGHHLAQGPGHRRTHPLHRPNDRFTGSNPAAASRLRQGQGNGRTHRFTSKADSSRTRRPASPWLRFHRPTTGAMCVGSEQ